MSAELKSKSDISIVLFFFTVLAVCGVAGGGFIVHDYARARASINWPIAQGIVLSHLDSEKTGLRYVYSMDGHSYESTRIRGFMNRRDGDIVRGARPGEAVTVYVNPQDYSYSVLSPGGASAAFVLFSLLSGFAIFVGFGGVVWTLSRTGEAQFELAPDSA